MWVNSGDFGAFPTKKVMNFVRGGLRPRAAAAAAAAVGSLGVALLRGGVRAGELMRPRGGEFAAFWGELTVRLGSSESVQFWLIAVSSSSSVAVGAVWIVLVMMGKLQDLIA